MISSWAVSHRVLYDGANTMVNILLPTVLQWLALPIELNEVLTAVHLPRHHLAAVCKRLFLFIDHILKVLIHHVDFDLFNYLFLLLLLAQSDWADARRPVCLPVCAGHFKVLLVTELRWCIWACDVYYLLILKSLITGWFIPKRDCLSRWRPQAVLRLLTLPYQRFLSVAPLLMLFKFVDLVGELSQLLDQLWIDIHRRREIELLLLDWIACPVLHSVGTWWRFVLALIQLFESLLVVHTLIRSFKTRAHHEAIAIWLF